MSCKQEKIVIYPGSFDPVTNGHIDLIQRASELFDKVIVAVLLNIKKKFLFTVDERLEMLQDSLKDIPCVEFDSFDGLLVDYAVKKGAHAVLRGMRAVSDFEYEFQLAMMNRKLSRDVQTVFMMTGLRWIFTSSSIIKEAVQFGGDVSDMVPACVEQKLLSKFPQAKKKT